ncbi:hypothetical protein AGLY_008438 [Aphis glycines]|uniref:Uncharacterized protein n=1 Tax=Aphis glycines TaxID=307491 RepID=A0A6G0TK03_APHGL|nr:hypothetical protein AGLY_008438 [Aphis glycines]
MCYRYRTVISISFGCSVSNFLVSCDEFTVKEIVCGINRAKTRICINFSSEIFVLFSFVYQLLIAFLPPYLMQDSIESESNLLANYQNHLHLGHLLCHHLLHLCHQYLAALFQDVFVFLLVSLFFFATRAESLTTVIDCKSSICLFNTFLIEDMLLLKEAIMSLRKRSLKLATFRFLKIY